MGEKTSAEPSLLPSLTTLTPFYYVISMQTYTVAFRASCHTQVKWRSCWFQLSFSTPVCSAAACCLQPLCRDSASFGSLYWSVSSTRTLQHGLKMFVWQMTIAKHLKTVQIIIKKKKKKDTGWGNCGSGLAWYAKAWNEGCFLSSVLIITLISSPGALRELNM